MNIKKESRILLLIELDSYIAAVVVRGLAGIEGVVLYENCNEMYEALKSGRGLLAEVNYVVSEYNICGDLELKRISIEEIEDKDLLQAINEVINILKKTKIRYTVLKSSLLNKTMNI